MCLTTELKTVRRHLFHIDDEKLFQPLHCANLDNTPAADLESKTTPWTVATLSRGSPLLPTVFDLLYRRWTGYLYGAYVPASWVSKKRPPCMLLVEKTKIAQKGFIPNKRSSVIREILKVMWADSYTTPHGILRVNRGAQLTNSNCDLVNLTISRHYNTNFWTQKRSFL